MADQPGATPADVDTSATEDEEAQKLLADAASRDDDDEEDPEGADQLGDPGKKALDRMKQQLRDERRRRKDVETKLAQAGKPTPNGDGQPDVETAVNRAREEVRAEALRDRVLDKIEAKARKFADSEDAAAILLRSHQVDDFIDGGKVDTEAIAEALDELAEAKPHLLARPATSGGSFDSGRGKKAGKGQLTHADVKKMTQPQIQAARKAGQLDQLMGRGK